jgi:DNA mismatch repair protein MutS
MVFKIYNDYMDTPMMKQYYSVKNKHLDKIVFFRMGDFFEMFGQDAVEVSNVLGITLTKRAGVTMCGIPCKAYDIYMKRLIRACRKQIVICDQIETAEEAKKYGRNIVNRDVVKIVSKGTFIDVTDPNNNFILAISKNESYHFYYYDLGTGECFYTTSTPFLFKSTLAKIEAAEIITDFYFEHERLIIVKEFHKASTIIDTLKKALEEYVNEMGYEFQPSIIQIISTSSHLKINESTLRNLEIFQDSQGKTDNSLFNLLDYTKTPMGKRILKNNLANPLASRSVIEEKQECVSFFLQRGIITGFLKLNISDITKMLNRISTIKDLKKTCENISIAINEIASIKDDLPCYLQKKCEVLKDFTIHKEILEVIYSREEQDFFDLPECHSLILQKQKKLEEIFDLPNKYNINCRIKENELSGYFLETNKKISIPQFFTKVRDLQNSVRYTTSDLLQLQDEINEINEDLSSLEKRSFEEWKGKLYSNRQTIEKISFLVGEIDYFQSCAIAAMKRNYTCPRFTDQKCFLVKEGRHPVISMRSDFINNDTSLKVTRFVESEQKGDVVEEKLRVSLESEKMYLITGPNMGGKSTYLRQNALFLIMAQCGMFVPCESLIMSVFDSLFVRVGSADNISEGQSTFMVEMQQCAEMIENSTEDSFLILDEVGRGTSTKDGVSISCALLEHIHNEIKCFAIISTHYIEMAQILGKLSFLRCKRMKILNNPLKFLYAIEDGIIDESFGIQVAKMAGIKESIVNRSKEILSSLELNIKIHF